MAKMKLSQMEAELTAASDQLKTLKESERSRKAMSVRSGWDFSDERYYCVCVYMRDFTLTSGVFIAFPCMSPVGSKLYSHLEEQTRALHVTLQIELDYRESTLYGIVLYNVMNMQWFSFVCLS